MRAEDKYTVQKKHGLILENREQLSLSGVSDVSGFDDESVTLNTELGELIIRGSGLHISVFSQESGELRLDGNIDSLEYPRERSREGGFFSKLFR